MALPGTKNQQEEAIPTDRVRLDSQTLHCGANPLDKFNEYLDTSKIGGVMLSVQNNPTVTR